MCALGWTTDTKVAPLAKNGRLDVYLPDQSTPVTVRIKQLQLEQVLTILLQLHTSSNRLARTQQSLRSSVGHCRR